MQHKTLLVVLVILSCFFIVGCNDTTPAKPTPSAVRGYLDLSSWDFQTDGVIKLDGEWAFYPNMFINPLSTQDNVLADLADYIEVPGSWN